MNRKDFEKFVFEMEQNIKDYYGKLEKQFYKELDELADKYFGNLVTKIEGNLKNYVHNKSISYDWENIGGINVRIPCGIVINIRIPEEQRKYFIKLVEERVANLKKIKAERRLMLKKLSKWFWEVITTKKISELKIPDDIPSELRKFSPTSYVGEVSEDD